MLPWYEQLTTALSKLLHIDDIQLFLLLTIIILGEIAGFVVGFLQNDHGGYFVPLGWSFPVAKGSARSIQVGRQILDNVVQLSAAFQLQEHFSVVVCCFPQVCTKIEAVVSHFVFGKHSCEQLVVTNAECRLPIGDTHCLPVHSGA